MRKGVTPMQNADGTTSTHVMAGGEGGSGKFKYTVNPTVFPNNGGKTWTDLREDPWGAYDEASKRGELIGFKSERRAEKFGMGSWKKGQAGREAMQVYREEKKAGNLYTQKKKVDTKIANIDNNKRLNRVVERRYDRMDKKYDRAADNPSKLAKIDKKYPNIPKYVIKRIIEKEVTGEMAFPIIDFRWISENLSHIIKTYRISILFLN